MIEILFKDGNTVIGDKLIMEESFYGLGFIGLVSNKMKTQNYFNVDSIANIVIHEVGELQ